MTGKTIVLGLDGANWDLLNPWINGGELPNLKKIREEGSWAESESQLPTVTCPNWKCYATGKNPGKFGVFWWQQVDRKNKRLISKCKSNLFDSQDIYDYISKADFRLGLINMPTTHPPKKVNGFMIAGIPITEEKDYTYPIELEKELKEKYNYQIEPKGQLDTVDNVRKTAGEIHSLIRLRFEVGLDRLKDVDFLQITIFNINVLQHFLFDEEATLQGWKIIDEYIGKIIDEENNIILLSDHGTHRLSRIFYKNVWLEKEGYLKLKKTNPERIGSLLRKIGITREMLRNISHRLGIKNALKKKIPANIYRAMPSQDGLIFGESGIPEQKIDWDKSKALATGQGSIYLLLDKKDREYSRIRDEIMDKLADLKTDNGLPVAKKIYRGEEFYSGKYVDDAPDIIYQQGRGVYSVGGMGKDEFFAKPTRWKAENLRIGIFLAYGPDIKKAGKIDQIRILDIAPTILHLMRVPVPKDMDGRVLTDIFREERPVEYQTTDEKDKLKEKIKNLKKLGKL